MTIRGRDATRVAIGRRRNSPLELQPSAGWGRTALQREGGRFCASRPPKSWTTVTSTRAGIISVISVKGRWKDKE
ncbi:MAG: hypothetical protein MZV64_59490 [Ignavibacteriales bacterium]|nr:hypothetical protein [Ignavibacteriales bacterium]